MYTTVAGSLAQETMGLDVRAAPAKQARWFSLGASSMVVLFASVRIFKDEDFDCGGTEANAEDGLEYTEFCKRTRLGISLGVITFVLSLVLSFGAAKIPLLGMVELAVSSVLLVMWCFGVGFITFGGDLSPGTHIGNLYFATWISFGLVVRGGRCRCICLVWDLACLMISFVLTHHISYCDRLPCFRPPFVT
jgi:hypothetical protein